MHTYKHAYSHIYITPIYIYKYTCTYMHTQTYTCMHLQTYTYVHVKTEHAKYIAERTLRIFGRSRLGLSRLGVEFTTSGATPTGTTLGGSRGQFRGLLPSLPVVSLRCKSTQCRSSILVHKGMF